LVCHHEQSEGSAVCGGRVADRCGCHQGRVQKGPVWLSSLLGLSSRAERGIRFSDNQQPATDTWSLRLGAIFLRRCWNRTGKKRVEKLSYMHRNPVKRGLVLSPEEWAWSSFRAYAFAEEGLVHVDACAWKFEVPISHSSENRGRVGHPAPKESSLFVITSGARDLLF
jgi:hypothetical protein